MCTTTNLVSSDNLSQIQSIAHNSIIWYSKSNNDRTLTPFTVTNMTDEHISNCIALIHTIEDKLATLKAKMSEVSFSIYMSKRVNINSYFTADAWLLIFENELAYRQKQAVLAPFKYQLDEMQSQLTNLQTQREEVKTKSEKKKERKQLRQELDTKIESLSSDINLLIVQMNQI